MPTTRLHLPGAVLALAAALLAAAPVARAQSRTTLLHDALKLSTAQETAWRTFLAMARPTPERRAQQEAAARLAPTLPTPRRLALVRSQMQADLAAFDRSAQAVDAFYAQLTPAQQAVFDRETRAGAADGAADGGEG